MYRGALTDHYFTPRAWAERVGKRAAAPEVVSSKTEQATPAINSTSNNSSNLIDAPAAGQQPAQSVPDGWQHDRGLLYILKDGANYFEVNVAMAYGDRGFNERARFAMQLLELLTAAPSDGWQPIETAPKDEWILLTGKHGMQVSILSFESQLIGATHWRPLPAAPDGGA